VCGRPGRMFGHDRGRGCGRELAVCAHLLLNPPCLLPISIPSFSPQLDHHRRIHPLSFFPLHFEVLSLPSFPLGSQITSPGSFPRSVSVPCLNSESLPRQLLLPTYPHLSRYILLCATLLLHHTSSAPALVLSSTCLFDYPRIASDHTHCILDVGPKCVHMPSPSNISPYLSFAQHLLPNETSH